MPPRPQALSASAQVLTSSALFARVAAFMSGVPGVVLAFKAQCERDNGGALNEALLARSAVRYGSKRVLRALQLLTSDARYETRMESPFDAMMGQLDMAFLEWLNVTITKPEERDIAWAQLVTIIKFGDLALIQWMHEHDIAFQPDMMDVAASVGRLDIVRFLHTHRSEGCTKMTMSDAAAKGRLEIVKFLHENRTEGCSSTGMNRAAQNGHLDCIQYLHEHNIDGFTGWTMHYAGMAGHLAIVKYLHEHRIEGCSATALIDAAKQRRDDVVDFLCEHRPMEEWIRKRLLEMAQQEELAHLVQCLVRVETLPVETQRYAYWNQQI